MKELVEKLVQALVDFPEEVEVRETEGTHMTLIQIKVAKPDLGKLIGKKGRNINALRVVVAGAGKGRRYMVEVAGEDQGRMGETSERTETSRVQGEDEIP
jgi:predicted RNA-binding protein YlqC (UPF0109 family)